MKKATGLGKGLGSLIPEKKAETVISASANPETTLGRVLEVSVDAIETNPRQPRTHFSPSHLEDLIASIKEYGIIQPLVVTQSDNGYQLIAGERRLRASKALGLETVPVVIRTATDQEKLVLALVENIQRHDLNPVEEARSYKALIDQFDLTQEDCAKKLGKSRSSIANTIRLLDLNDEMLEALSEGEITRSHARALLAQADPMLRNQMFLQMLSGDMTVREAEKLSTTKKKKPVKLAKDPNIEAQERSLESIFGTKVRIEKKANDTGQVVLEFYSSDEYYTILDLLGTISV
ncbi:MAG TPA: ParB/RepB/Spo0J family partition protein [Patescibacteria group bacterium]|nr:ParB/RepB/Spo0J family partition protein [Patescibacteria group bacterium]